MASISKDSSGRRTIQFIDTDRKRKSIRLGRTSARNAESVRFRIEQLLAAKISGHPLDRDLSLWVSGLDSSLHDKLVRVSLLKLRHISRLKPFTDHYIDGRKDLKPGTLKNLKYCQVKLIALFGEEKEIQSFTEGDADDFRQQLLSKGMAENTVRRTCGRARQFFNAAIRKRLIEINPFSDIACSVQPNHEKFFFVTREISDKYLSACPHDQWRLLFILCRFGGLRCPSEVMKLTWSDINWEHNRMVVNSPKTEHIPGKGSRVIPIFSELETPLRNAFEQAEDGSTNVITFCRGGEKNLRTQFSRIAKRAGLVPWQKPFQNLRSTRETELAEEFPMHVVCRWIGNSELVAAKHYLQMTDEHFEKAVQKAVQSSHAEAGQAEPDKKEKA